MMTAAAQCRLQVIADPRDEKLSNEPMKVQAAFDTDLLEPQIVLDWMDENEFAQAHDGWHLVRKWDQTCRMSNAPADCLTAQNLTSQGLERAPIQQGAPGDGLAFMMMHRHMIMMLKTAFPKHTKLFEGFTKVPRAVGDAENPVPGRQISWTPSNVTGFDTLENIEKHLDQFPTEDDLGAFEVSSQRGEPITARELRAAGSARALADMPLFAAVRRLHDQPLISMLPLAAGPFFVCSSFDKDWRQGTIRPLHTLTHVTSAYVPGLTPGSFEATGIDRSALGSYELRLPWRLSLPYPPYAAPYLARPDCVSSKERAAW
jgi:hypothetical protein